MKENGGLFTSKIRRATYFVGRKVQRAVRQDMQLLQGRGVEGKYLDNYQSR